MPRPIQEEKKIRLMEDYLIHILIPLDPYLESKALDLVDKAAGGYNQCLFQS